MVRVNLCVHVDFLGLETIVWTQRITFGDFIIGIEMTEDINISIGLS